MRRSLIGRLQENDVSLAELAGFGSHSINQVSSSLVKNTTVTSFKFNSCDLDDEDCAILMKALISRYEYQSNNLCITCRPRTKRILLARNNIGIAGAQQIARFLCFPSIEYDRKKNNHASPTFCRGISTCDCCGAKRDISLRLKEDFIRLELFSNKVGDEGVTAIANAIASTDRRINDRSHCIVELGFERNEISNVGMISISKMLTTNKSLHTLHLGRNVITHDGIIHLSNALKRNSTLEVLNLTGNVLIGDKGAAILSESLNINTTLQTLLLKKCGIGDRGANCLIRALYHAQSPYDLVRNSNHTLRDISLCSRYLCKDFVLNNVTLRILLSCNGVGGSATAQRLKLGFYLYSDHGIRYVHSLGLDRKLFPALLCKLRRIHRDDYMLKLPTNNLGVLWNYLRGMPEILEEAHFRDRNQHVME